MDRWKEERVWRSELQHVFVLYSNKLDFHMSAHVITFALLVTVTVGNEITELVPVRL
jgi:hypothetical protein